MKVEAIQQVLAEYKSYLQSNRRFDFNYLFEITDHLHRCFQSEEDYRHVIQKGMRSQRTQRLWYRPRYEPKQNLLELADIAPDYFNNAMRDLLNEEKELENRVDRFKFYCDELLHIYKGERKHSTLNHHYVDESFISILLMGKYPDAYAYYDLGLFQSIAERTGAKPIPTVNDYARYQKWVNIFSNFIKRDQDLIDRIEQRNSLHLTYANLSVECMAVSCKIDLTA